MIQAFDLCADYRRVRQQSLTICQPLENEDYGVQPMDDASPPKWHLAHTTWFFETFLLKPHVPGYDVFHPQFETLFNSYYNGVGQPFPRPRRGFLSRPTVAEIFAYRQHVDQHVLALLANALKVEQLQELVTLGLNHEQQHQELMLTDIKYNFANNPLFPVYGGQVTVDNEPGELVMHGFEGGITEIGIDATSSAFKFDNECPRHEALIHPFKFADRLISNAEYLAFIQDGGYQTSSLWLSEGWATVVTNQWQHPLYWHEIDGEWFEYRLDGLHALNLSLPAVHISAHEAIAFANWRGARLPSEFEWEYVANSLGSSVQDTVGFLEQGSFHPSSFGNSAAVGDIQQMQGSVWQWTGSSYGPYPGFKPLPGTLGEYNGKFMSSQLVLRGGSCVTPRSHVRPTYRNFFYPPDRWQFSGIRLAED